MWRPQDGHWWGVGGVGLAGEAREDVFTMIAKYGNRKWFKPL